MLDDMESPHLVDRRIGKWVWKSVEVVSYVRICQWLPINAGVTRLSTLAGTEI
jgi:hypothetical protein